MLNAANEENGHGTHLRDDAAPTWEVQCDASIEAVFATSLVSAPLIYLYVRTYTYTYT